MVEFFDGGIQIVAGEIRPQNVHFYQLRVSCLPEHEVGQPLFSAGTQDKIRILLARGIHRVAEQLFRDLFGLYLPCRRLCRQS